MPQLGSTHGASKDSPRALPSPPAAACAYGQAVTGSGLEEGKHAPPGPPGFSRFTRTPRAPSCQHAWAAGSDDCWYSTVDVYMSG